MTWDAENDSSVTVSPTGEIWSIQSLRDPTSSLWDTALDVPSNPTLQGKLLRIW